MTEAAELERPLNPDLNYYDATPSIEALTLQMKDLQDAMKLQISINSKLLLQQQDLVDRVSLLEAQAGKPKLILPERMN